MTRLEQLQQWVVGNSLHNYELDECCPDFSCCSGQPAAAPEVRQRFQRAYLNNEQPVVDMMLGFFLTQAIALHCGKCVHVAGQPVEEH